MSPTKGGLLIALVFTGMPLYRKVEAGQMDLSGAMLRVLLVTIVCTMAIRWILSLVASYEAGQDTKAKAIERFLDEADATDLAAAEQALRRMEAPQNGTADGGFQPMITPPNG